ncbi:putative transcriptional regulator [Selenomonas ruminantium]|uniref:Putative transcriptional regulator n=1 Tax=Selenomonas ruminantium TaxID=971 RepID=A0A1M6X8Z3_SELRU|nr:helix-turn-helix transcriptional regulator [Selenomonas ruminantium]SHL02339.1 putative transcriptional regulator [Selenomonas ruminantium]
MTELITKIYELRRARKMSQNELAEAVGVRQEPLSHLENGKYVLSLKLAMDVAKVFGKTVEDVFEFIEEETED